MATKQNTPPLKNKTPKLGEELAFLVRKHKNGENILPRLTSLVTTYNGQDKCKIIAQICSYSILFSNNLRAGIDWFIILIDHPGMKNSYLITVSIFTLHFFPKVFCTRLYLYL